MLRRFYDLRNCVKKALVDVSPNESIEEREVQLLEDIVLSLEPIEATVEALCRRDANLISADATLSFTLKKLKEQDSSLSLKLFQALSQRIEQRRTDVSGVLQFLHTNGDSALNDSDLDSSWLSEI